MGAKITFASGRSLAGDIQNGYIDVANEFGSLGLWDLSAVDGIEKAIADIAKDAQDSHIDLHGREIIDGDYDDLADVLYKHIEAVDEMTIAADGESTLGYIFDAKTITKLLPGYIGESQYLTLDNGYARCEDYNPEKHVSEDNTD
jgi:hypothetical protein